MTTGWICPKCNAGVAPTCARCPCVDIAKRFVHPVPWHDKGPVTYPDAVPPPNTEQPCSNCNCSITTA